MLPGLAAPLWIFSDVVRSRRTQDRERAADAAEAGLSSLGGAQARALAFGRAVGSTISGGSAPAPGAGADCARRGVVAARLETRQNGRARGVILCVPPPGAAVELAICGLRQAAERHHRFRVPLGVASKLYYPRSRRLDGDKYSVRSAMADAVDAPG